MKVYAVGGCVRDKLLGLKVEDNDWVVVGSTPEKMLAEGFKPIGKDFPVFLHPKTKEEYALARTERKTHQGYHGFEFYSAPSVTLDEDLARRDLTINAMALSPSGELFDPFNGKQDIEDRQLRHVSDAFNEDPVRVLRLARFAAKFKFLNFKIAPETFSLLKDMVKSGEVDALVAERVWHETHKALLTDNPEVFFETLQKCGALQVIMPELAALWGVPNPAKHHPEIDTGIHTMMVLQQACLLSKDPVIRFASIMHDLGKGITPKSLWPSHHGHEEAGVKLVKNLCKRLRVPKSFTELSVLGCQYHGQIHRAQELKPSTLVKLLQKLDAYRKPERLEKVLLVCIADSRGRIGFETKPYPQSDLIKKAYDATKTVDASSFVEAGLSGEQIKNKIFEARIRALKNISD